MTNSAATQNLPANNEHLELGITGMTCPPCSAPGQRKLNKVGGVEAGGD